MSGFRTSTVYATIINHRRYAGKPCLSSGTAAVGQILTSKQHRALKLQKNINKGPEDVKEMTTSRKKLLENHCQPRKKL
jgi:hypothetical protein